MRTPEQVRDLLAKHYRRYLTTWLAQDDPEQWPISIPLRPPTSTQVHDNPAGAAHWIRTWAQAGSPRLPWRVLWEERHWRGYGKQSVPVRVEVDDAAGVARLAGQLADWQMLSDRTRDIAARWGGAVEPHDPQQAGARTVSAEAVARALEAVRHCDAADFDRALRVVDWLVANPSSGMLLRQVPVEGMDTKWLERHQGLVGALLEAARRMLALPGGSETGLKRETRPLDVVILDPALRPRSAGASTAIRHLRVDPAQLADMWEPPAAEPEGSAHPEVVLVCENRQSLLALPDMAGVVALHGGGYAVDVLGQMPWAAALPLIYWGDLDRDGFAILDRLRHHHGCVTSVLMDTATLGRHRALCVSDPHPEPVTLTRLTPAEAETRAALMGSVAADGGAGVGSGADGRTGGGPDDAVGTTPLRLEQERIAWDWAEPRIRQAVESARQGRRDEARHLTGRQEPDR